MKPRGRAFRFARWLPPVALAFSVFKSSSSGFAAPGPPDLGILQRYAPGVLVFGAEYCGPCKVFCKRLKGLNLEEGKHWHYVDAEDFSPKSGAELLGIVGLPFAPLPLLAVLNSKGERSLLRAGQELLQAGDTELRSWFDGSYSTPEKDTSCGLFQRSDLDAIENGILEKVKEKRQVCHVSSVGQASVPIKAEETPRPKSAATLTTEVRGSKSAPQLAVLAMAPKPQLLKAPDCFDLWREFDSMQHASEEAEKRRNKQAQAKRYLEALNEQLQQAQARKDAEVVEKQRDRQAILEEVQRSHRNASAELQKKQQKKQLQKEAALDLLARVEKQKGAAVQRLQVAKMAMDRTLAAEEQYRQQELLKQQKHREDESLLMRRQYESSQAAQQDSKQKEKEADQRLASEWKRIAAKPPEAELPGGMLHKIRENQKRVDTLVDTMGVALVQKQRAQDAAEEQRVQRDCRAYEKKRLEELFARQDQRTRRTREMVEGFRKKIQEGNNKGADEKAADQWQAEVWRQSRETAEAEEAKKQMLKREARKELDKQLFADMMKTTGMKKLRRPGNLEQDLLLNRPLVEQMVKSGYKTELTVPMLEKALDLKAEQARKRVESR